MTKWACLWSRDLFKFLETSDNISEMVQDRDDVFTGHCNSKGYITNPIAVTAMTLKVFKGHQWIILYFWCIAWSF